MAKHTWYYSPPFKAISWSHERLRNGSNVREKSLDTPPYFMSLFSDFARA